jgi:hypothetical protein
MLNHVTANAKVAENNVIKPIEGLILRRNLECSPYGHQLFSLASLVTI